MLPILLRRHGVVTRAFVNNYFMVGYAAVGVDMGFEGISDYRYRTRDTGEITTHAVQWLEGRTRTSASSSSATTTRPTSRSIPPIVSSRASRLRPPVQPIRKPPGTWRRSRRTTKRSVC